MSSAIQDACAQLGRGLEQLGEHFPGDTSESDRFWPSRWPEMPRGTNGSWTAGFWTACCGWRMS